VLAVAAVMTCIVAAQPAHAAALALAAGFPAYALLTRVRARR
jgi:EamA domain-containing membrane protein RarD